MAEYEPKPRKCTGCGHIFKDGEKRCPFCYPMNPHLRKKRTETEIVQESQKTEPWYCPDCAHKFGPEFQKCPVCRSKTHKFCEECGTLIQKNQPCPICDDESDVPPVTGDDILEVQISSEEEHLQREVTEEDEREIERLLTQNPEIPLEPVIANPGKRKPWSAERREAYAEKRRKGEIGRPKKQEQTEAKQEALKKTQAAKKPDGRKQNRPPKAKNELGKDTLDREYLIKLTNALGEHEIKIDFDDRDNFSEFLTRMHLVRRSLGLAINDLKVCDTKHGEHIWLYLKNPLPRYEVILIQLLLGDDYKHALAAYNQLRMNTPPDSWNLLFKEKYYVNQVGQVYKASEEQLNEELTKKALIFLTSQLGGEKSNG